MKKFFENTWTFRCLDSNGKVLWEDKGLNSLTKEGAEWMLKNFLRNDAAYAPVQFYVRLCNDSLTENDTLSTILNEPAGTYGYAPQLVERSAVGFSTESTVDGHEALTTKEVTFTASGGDIGPVTTAFLATSADNSGALIFHRALALSRTITTGNSGLISIQIVLKPGS